MSLGHINKFKVLRETQLGYVIGEIKQADVSNDENLEKEYVEYFLHRNECAGKTPIVDQYVEAFIYVDKKGREAATLHIPTITCDSVGIGEIIDVKNDLGAFVNIGISKDILLSKDDLPINYRVWPRIGDKVACSMKIRAKKLILKLASKNEILKNKNDYELAEGEKVDAYVYRITDDGINLVTDTLKVIFVYKTNYRGNFHLGQKASVKIIRKNLEDYSGSLIEQKEVQIQDDKNIILEYLKNHNGVMMITEDSSPELINRLFKMSKKAFKNALGGLLKNNLIEIESDKIILIE